MCCYCSAAIVWDFGPGTCVNLEGARRVLKWKMGEKTFGSAKVFRVEKHRTHVVYACDASTFLSDTRKPCRCSLGNFSRHRRRRRLIARKTSVCPSSARYCPPPTSLVALGKSGPDQPPSNVAVASDDLTSSCQVDVES